MANAFQRFTFRIICIAAPNQNIDSSLNSGQGIFDFMGQARGTFTFDASCDGSVLIVPRAVVGRDGLGRAWLTTVTEHGERAGAGELAGSPQGRPPAGVRWHDGSLPAPIQQRAYTFVIPDFKPVDYDVLCQAYLGPERTARLGC